MRHLLIAAVLVGALMAPAASQQPAPLPKTITYTLTQDQVNTLYAAMVAADFWLKVKAESLSNSLDARGFELQRKELQTLSVEMGKQAAAAAEKQPAVAPPPEATQESKP